MFKYQNLKGYMYFWMFWTMDPFLWNILKFTNKLKQFGEHLIRTKGFWNKKTTYPHAFLECFKNIKGFLKHDEFSLKFCSCNFESIKTYLKNKQFFWYIMFPWWFFKKSKNILKGLPTHFVALFFMLSPQKGFVEVQCQEIRVV
jgi:hypothetical protein